MDRVINNADDIKKLNIPDAYKNERTLDRIKGAEAFTKLLKGEVPVIGWIEGPLAEACDLGGKVKLHICGNITHLLPSIKEINADIVDLDWQVSLNDAFEQLGHESVLCGNGNKPYKVIILTTKRIFNKVRYFG